MDETDADGRFPDATAAEHHNLDGRHGAEQTKRAGRERGTKEEFWSLRREEEKRKGTSSSLLASAGCLSVPFLCLAGRAGLWEDDSQTLGPKEA